MSEQFITPTQPEDNLKDTPGNSDWDTVAGVVSREVGASEGLAIDYDTLPLTHEAMGLPSPEKKKKQVQIQQRIQHRKELLTCRQNWILIINRFRICATVCAPIW